MKFIADHLSLMSLDDTEFINTLIFNPFFNAEVFKEVLDSFVNENAFPSDHQLSSLTYLFQNLGLQSHISENEVVKKEA